MLGRGSWSGICENEGVYPGITMYIEEDVDLLRAMKKEQTMTTKNSVWFVGV